ncbi:hypothetical protein [Aporhodopirellula aestuarii]|uniref:Transmembrane protein n=1 Tax=Aporhodopirellula aestuarii TaxID=2950107 RepID=A0ABT0U8M2_9BACT|nr:hypothetical protein [Aporhodopirellula aestuarii]MCM2372758.1 hypothetical protein [Aporhodopirellula aestuarii]
MITDDDLFIRKDLVSWLVTASLFAYVASFVMPVVDVRPSLLFRGREYPHGIIGVEAFVIAFWAMVSDGDSFVWLANPTYWFAIVLLFRGSVSFWPLTLSVIALLSPFLMVHSMNETWLLGYYTWLLSFGFSAAASLIVLWRGCSTPEQNIAASNERSTKKQSQAED